MLCGVLQFLQLVGRVLNLQFASAAEYVAPAWRHLMGAKALLYEAMADYYTAVEQLEDVRGASRNAKAATFTGDLVKEVHCSKIQLTDQFLICPGVARLCRAEDILRRLLLKLRDLMPNDHGMIKVRRIFLVPMFSSPHHFRTASCPFLSCQSVENEMTLVKQHMAKFDANVIFDHVDSRQQLIKDMMPTKAEAELLCHPTYPHLHQGVVGEFGGQGRGKEVDWSF